MGRNSALARVIGLTRSFAPRSFEGTDDAELAADALVRQASEEAAPAMAGPAPADVVVAFPAMAQATILAADALDPLSPVGEPAAGPTDEAISFEAINALEADIASLLATLDHGEPTDEDLAGKDRLFDSTAGEDEPMAMLLSELNRLWQADSDIGGRPVH
ncbi:MAG: hypothetical protein P4M09_06250 [Devosia sp.]|nr:hypothetical protein [Devosia sp.]